MIILSFRVRYINLKLFLFSHFFSKLLRQKREKKQKNNYCWLFFFRCFMFEYRREQLRKVVSQWSNLFWLLSFCGFVWYCFLLLCFFLVFWIQTLIKYIYSLNMNKKQFFSYLTKERTLECNYCHLTTVEIKHNFDILINEVRNSTNGW